MDKRFYKALASSIYVNSMALAGRAITTDDQRLRAAGLYADWIAGAYAVGDICNAEGQTWECFQAHDNAVYPDIAPDSAAWLTFWRPLHGKSAATARPWVAPAGAHDIYKAGEYMVWTDGTTRRCKADTAYSPDDYPNGWEEVSAK